MVYFEPNSISAQYCDEIWRLLFGVRGKKNTSLFFLLFFLEKTTISLFGQNKNFRLFFFLLLVRKRSIFLLHSFISSALLFRTLLFIYFIFFSQNCLQVSWFEWRKKFVSLYAYEVPPSSLYDKIFQRLKDFIGNQKKNDFQKRK